MNAQTLCTRKELEFSIGGVSGKSSRSTRFPARQLPAIARFAATLAEHLGGVSAGCSAALRVAILVVIPLTAGHSATGQTPDSLAACGSAEGSAPPFEFTGTEKDFPLYYPTYLANGYFTATTSVRGTEPTLSLMAGVMDYTPKDISRLAAIPSWDEIDYFDGKSQLNSAPLTPEVFSNYRQTLHMNEGVLATSYTWIDGDRSTAVSVCSFLSEKSTHVGATRITITPDFTGLITLHFTLRAYPAPAHRLDLATKTGPEIDKSLGIPVGSGLKKASPTAADRAAIWYPGEVRITSYGGDKTKRLLWMSGRAVNGASMSEAAAVKLPDGLTQKPMRVNASADLVDLEISAAVEKGKQYSFTKFVAVAREGWGKDPATAMAQQALEKGFHALLADHEKVWHNLWQSDVAVDGDAEVQRAIHSDLFYLLENSTPDSDIPMLACGLTPNYYSHVFWDSDSWDFPVMLLLHPDRAKSLVMFRYRTLAAAEARAREQGYKGAMFPWESDPVNGTDVTPHFVQQFAVREVHVNGDVAIAQWQYYLATGDKLWLKQYGYPVLLGVAEFWKSRITFDREKGRYEIVHVTSTDEAYDDVPNDAFTNAVAQKALRIASKAARVLGVTPDPEWDRIADAMYIPFSKQFDRHLVFDESVPHNLVTWGASSIAMLALPSLDLSMPEAVRRNDFALASENTNKLATDANQNGLFFTMLPLEAATLGLSTDSSVWVKRSMSGFLKPPFNVRSETAENNTLYILAVSGGFLQDFLYGFSGLRFTDEGLAPVYPPVLPSFLKSITLHGIHETHQLFDLQISRDASGKTYLRKIPIS